MNFSIIVNICSVLLCVGISALLHHPKFQTFFNRFELLRRNVLIGIIYGLMAGMIIIFSTVPLSGNSGNVCYTVDAPPVIAGLLFDFPAGIIAGVIAAVFRFASILWAGDSALRIAGSLGVLLCGCLATLVKKLFFKTDYKPNFIHAFCFALLIEIYGDTLIFLFNLNNLYKIFGSIQDILLPAIGFMTSSVTLSVLVVSIIRKEPICLRPTLLIRSFEKYLLCSIIGAVVLVMFFSTYISGKISIENYGMQLASSIDDILQETEDQLNQDLMERVRLVETEIQLGNDDFNALAEKYDVSDINIIQDNINVKSNLSENIGFDMRSSDQSSSFMKNVMVNGTFVQEYLPMGQFSDISKKYAGVKLDAHRVLQIGYNTEQFQKAIQEYLYLAAKYRHVGTDGEILVYDATGTIIASRNSKEGQSGYLFEKMAKNQIPILEMQENTFDGVDCTWMYNCANDFYYVAMVPTSEILFSRDLTATLTLFICIILFSVVFGLIYLLLKELVIRELDAVNVGLSEVTNGNLDMTIDASTTKEFIELSDDINSMITSLKGFIHDAETRYEKDLNNARIIQYSALPSYQQFCKTRKDIQLYASMNPAQDVGGDFYDFYTIEDNKFVFCIADVSGKGIPAAMFMMRAKTLLRSTMEKHDNLAVAFEETNNQICESNEAGLFVTVWMGVCDMHKGVLNFVNAGHNPPLLCRYNGTFEYLKTRPNLVVGGMSGMKYKMHTVDFHPGDQLFLYTDGVTEANNADRAFFGEDRLIEVLNRHMQNEPDLRLSIEENCKAVHTSLNDFVGDAEQFDDITMLGINCIYQQEGDYAEFSGSKETPLYSQQFLDECNDNHKIPQKTARHIQICSDEIVSNIVKYGHANTIHIRYKVDNNAVILEYEDDGALYDPLESSTPDITLSAAERKIGGLGLFMVKKIASFVEYAEKEGWNTLRLTFEFDPNEFL